MNDEPKWTACRYADMCSEEGWCANGCEMRHPDWQNGGYMRHPVRDDCECQDCHVARRANPANLPQTPAPTEWG